ncbi:MAG: protein kinase [Gemmatimonadaceae bacterium]|nr:protein kinase [Gemmatimonadaceae bacterium]
MAKLCPQCGKEYGDDDRFCTIDGAALVASGSGANALIGTVLADRYLVKERLGEGGMGEVYLAEHVRIKRKVAVKLMRSWMLGDPVAVSRFHREAENASQISHPNVAQIYDFGETSDGMIYLAMEFVPGEPLSSILDREGRLHTVRAVEIIRQTSEALVAAHGMGILHRDLKPDNVMVARTRAGTDLVKLVDFGIARMMSRGTQQFTSTGMIVGTPDYMSPEQLTGDVLDERSDLYALALIAFRVLTGSSAFKASGGGDALMARMLGKPRALGEVLPEVEWPAGLQAAFDRALDVEPSARYADAMEFVAELDGAVSEMPLTEEDQAYLLLLSQRMATPSRGGMAIDSSTPVRSMSAVRGSLNPTPTSGERSVSVVTPPSESQAIPRPTLPPTTVSPAATPGVAGDGDTGERRAPTVETAASRAIEPAPDVTKATPTVKVRHAGATTPLPAVGDGADARHLSPPSERPAAARGGKLGMLAAAALGIAVLGFAATKMLGGKGEQPPAVSAATDSIVSEVAPSASDSAPSATLPAAAGADSEYVQRARSGVLFVTSSAGRGSAFLVDSAGIFLTAASLVPPDQRVDVFIDGEHSVKASVASIDSANGVAALVVSPRRCRRCRTLDVGRRDTTATAAAVGDSLLALRVVGRSTVTQQPVVVARVSGTTLAAAGAVGNAALGAPVLNPRTGGVAGIVTRRRGSTAIVGAGALRSLLHTARGAAAAIVPDTTLTRSWPARPVPSDAIAAAEAGSVDLQQYRVTQGGFDVLAMTPQLLAWRMAKSAPAPSDNPFDIGARTPAGPPDPLLEWKAWRDYREERRAVVILEVSPDKAAYPQRPDKPLDARKGDFYSMSITRNGTPLIPLESQTIHAVGNPDAYKRDRKSVPNAGIYVFHPSDFADPSAAYQVQVVDADQKRRVTMSLTPAMLQSIARDLGGWLR